MKIKKGNALTLKVLAKDSDGNIISNLSTATEVAFMVKVQPTDIDGDAEISKNLADGITIDDPSTGFVKIILKSGDTDIDARTYYMALQVTYSVDDIQEINLVENNQVTNEFIIEQDIIR